MLGKLFKYEFKNTSKVMLTLYAVLVAVTLVGMSVLGFNYNGGHQSRLYNTIVGFIIFTYVLALIALVIMTFIYMCSHFYKTMFSAQGYLTHTLPVKPLATFHVKVVVSFVWLLVSTLLCAVSIFGLVAVSAGPGFFDEFKDIDIAGMNDLVLSITGMSFGMFVLVMVLGVILSCLSTILWIYASFSIGQLFNQYKVVASIVSGIVLYFIMQIISTIFMFTKGMSVFYSDVIYANQEVVAKAYGSVIWMGLGISALYVVMYYVICNIIIRKHINLD